MPDVPAPDPAEAEDAVDPVAWLCGDHGAKARTRSGGGKRNSVADRDKPIRAVDDKCHEIPAWPCSDERVAGGGGEGAWSRKCNHGCAIGGVRSAAPTLYG